MRWAQKSPQKRAFLFLLSGSDSVLVPEERLELSLLSEHEFESCASTDSAIPAEEARILYAGVGVGQLLATVSVLFCCYRHHAGVGVDG